MLEPLLEIEPGRLTAIKFSSSHLKEIARNEQIKSKSYLEDKGITTSYRSKQNMGSGANSNTNTGTRSQLRRRTPGITQTNSALVISNMRRTRTPNGLATLGRSPLIVS